MWLLFRESLPLVFSGYSNDCGSIKPNGKLLYS